MRTLLLRPPPAHHLGGGFRVPPLGLLQLASSLLARRHPVALLDAAVEHLSWNALIRLVRNMRPDLIGMTVLTPVRAEAYRAARVLRPFVKHIVLGGPHPTAVGADVFRECPEADFVAIGEGEHAMVSLVEALIQDTPDRVFVPGIVRRGCHGGAAPPPDLDALPAPAVHLLPLRAYHHPLATRLPMFTLVTSRGCPGRCTFCAQSVSGAGWRGMSADRVVAEMVRLEHMGVRYVSLYDDDFTADRDRTMAICRRLVSQGTRLSWKCEARVDQVDRELLHWLARAGCKTIGFGVETAHQAGLDRLAKGATVTQARDALRWARSAGIETLAYVLVGIPGESPAHVRRTLDFCIEAKVSVIQVATLSAMPGTALWAEALDQGWSVAGHVRSLFDDEPDRATLIAPGWTPERLERTMADAQRRAYLRPRFVWSALRRCRTWSQGAAVGRESIRTLVRRPVRRAASLSR